MPTVPVSRNTSVRLSPLPGVRVNTSAPLSAFGGGEALTQSNNAAQNLNNDLSGKAMDIMVKQQQNANDVRVQAADLELSKAQTDVQVMAQNMRGENAFGAPDVVDKEWKTRTDKIREGLSNDQQKAQFDKMYGARTADLYRSTQNHVASESKKYDLDLTNAYVSEAQNQAAINYMDVGPKGKVEQSIYVQEQALAKYGMRNGVPPEVIQQQAVENKSKTYTAVIGQMLANRDTYAANSYLTMKKADISVEDQAKVQKMFKASSEFTKDTLTEKLFDGILTLEEIEASANPEEEGGTGAAWAKKMMKDLGKTQTEKIETFRENSDLADKYVDLVDKVFTDKDSFKMKEILVDAFADGTANRQETQKLNRLIKLMDKKRASGEDNKLSNGFGMLRGWFDANENDKRELANAISNYTTFMDSESGKGGGGGDPEQVTEKILRDQYNKLNPQAPLGKDDKVFDPKREREISFVPVERALKGVARGAAGTVESFGAGLEWLGAKEVGKAFQEWGETAKTFYKVEDPTYLDQVYEGLGSMTTFFIPGLGISKGVQLLKIAPKIATWLGVGTATVLESVVESGSTYKQAIENGYGDKSASLSATSVFWANLPAIAVTNKLGVFGDKGTKIFQVLTAGTMEGAQEFTQALIGDIALSDPINWKEATVSASIGFITGSGVKTAETVTQTLDELGVAQEFMDSMKGLPGGKERGSVVNPFGGDNQKPIEIQTTQEQTDMINEGGNADTPQQVQERAGAEQAKAMIAETEKILGDNPKPSEFKKIIREQTGQTQDSKDLLNYLKEKYANEIQAFALEKEIGEKLAQPLQASEVKNIVRESTGQVKDQGGQVSERTAFLQSLKDRVKAAKQAENFTREQIFDTQNDLINLIDQSELEANDKAKFLKMIKNIQTPKDLVKVMQGTEKTAGLEDRIDTLISKEERRSIVSDIKNAVNAAKNSNSIAVDYVKAIEAMVEDVDLKNRKPETIARIQAMKDFLDTKIKAGQDVEVTREMLKDLKILEKKKFEDMSNEDLTALLRNIEKAIQLGQTKLQALENIRATKKENALQELVKGSVPIESKDIKQGKIGQKLSAGDKFKNSINQSLNKIQEVDLAISPMDVVFDVLDGDKNYKGPNYKIFKQTVDKLYSKYLAKVDVLLESVYNLSNELKLTEESLEKIGFYAAKIQKGGADKLMGMGYTEQEIEAVQLNEKEMKLYTIMREKLDALRPEIQEVMRLAYNQDLDVVDDYFPFMTDFDAMSDSELRERFGNNVELVGMAKKKNVKKGFTEKRVGGKQRIRLNAIEVFNNHVDNAVYLVELGPTIKDLGDIAQSQEYGEAVGELGQEVVRDWIDLLARKGGTAGKRIRILDKLRKNVGVATLGFKLSSFLIQPTALMDGASMIGGKAFEGAFNVATSREWRQFLKANFPELRARGADDPAYLEFGGNDLRDKAGRAGFWALRNMDMLTASSVVAGAYSKAVEDKGGKVDFSRPDQDAIVEAQRILRRTQASAFPKDLPSAISQGGLTGNVSLDKLVLQFQSFMINRWSLVRHDMMSAGIKEKNAGKLMNMFFFLAMANFAEVGVRRFSKELLASMTGEDLKDWDETFNKEIVLSTLGNIPFVSHAISAINYGSVPVPAIDMGARIIERLNRAATAKRESTKDKNFKLGLMLGLGVAFRIPGTVQGEQIMRQLIGGNNDRKKTKNSFE